MTDTHSLPAAMQNNYSVLTPYIIPESMRGRKVVNIGDGFILRAIERLLGPFQPDKVFSPRVAPDEQTRAMLNQSTAVVLAGANQLNNNYTVWPGLSADAIRHSTLRLVPFGIGLHGEPGFSDVLSAETRAVLLAMHERIEYSSWRCPHTAEFLRQQLPEIAPQILMTGCPVTYDRPLLEGTPFSKGVDRIAVTITERHDFWDRETAIIDFAARQFPRAERFLVLHQNYSPPRRLESVRHRWFPYWQNGMNDYERIRLYAVQKGYRVIIPESADAAIAFYDRVDMHIGSRLHAHLLCLSRARRSALVAVDGRATGMAEFLGFPLYAPEHLEQALEFDFEVVRENARHGFSVMNTFLESLPR